MCLTSREVCGVPCPLGGCLADYIQRQSNCTVLHADCFWLLQTPTLHRLKALNTEVRREVKADQDSDDQVVFESLFCQQVLRCPKREAVFQEYDERLSTSERVEFRTQTLTNGLPPKSHIGPLFELLVQSSSMPILISLDHFGELEDAARSRLIARLGSLRRIGSSFKILICGNTSLSKPSNKSDIPVVTDDTETQGM